MVLIDMGALAASGENVIRAKLNKNKPFLLGTVCLRLEQVWQSKSFRTWLCHPGSKVLGSQPGSEPAPDSQVSFLHGGAVW